MPDLELCLKSATELRRMLGTRELSARELTDAHLAQIERQQPKVNAFVTVAAEQAIEQAEAADQRAVGGAELPALHGLPLAVKDLIRTRGLRTTFGSLLYADNVPDADDLLAARYRDAGAIFIGKTNTPEFGCGGGQTTNAVCGDTRNPYDLDRACGSSSGGSAVALAARMTPLADGSDFGGSLRHPGRALQCRRIPAVARTRPRLSGRARLVHAAHGRADGTMRCGHGLAPVGAGGSRSALAHCLARARTPLRAAARA